MRVSVHQIIKAAILIICALQSISLLAAAERTHSITIDDYFTQAWISSSITSPSGKQVAYVDQRWDQEADIRRAELWVASTQKQDQQRLTFDGNRKQALSWGSQGKYIYFTSSRDLASNDLNEGTSQIWRIAISGGEAQAITSVSDGIGIYEMSAKNNAIYYTVQISQFADEWEKLRSEHPALIYGREQQVMTEIWQLDLKSWRSELVTSVQGVLTSFSVAPDGNKFAFVSKPDTTLLSGEGWSVIEIFDFASGELSLLTKPGWRVNHPSPHGWQENVCWSADSKLLAFTIDFDGYPAEMLIWDLDNEKLYQLDRPFQVSLNAGTLNWRGASGRLCFMAADHGRRRVYSISAAEKVPVNDTKILTPGDVVIDQYSFDRRGKVMVVAMSTPEAPQDLYSVTGKKAAYSQLTKVNPQIDTWEIPQITTISWNGGLNDQVEGILMLPHDYRPGRALPLVVSIHGGPTSAATFSFYYGYGGEALFTAQGFAVFSPNYRGSTGYGDEFMVQLIGNENNLDVKDILTGVDALVQQGIVDPGQMAVMGWSNGGYLTNCIITKTNRFKAAISGAGVLDQSMQWGLEDTPGHVINYMEGLPWEKAEEYQHSSALYNLDKVKTPTLIHVGENDQRVPSAHSKTLFRALDTYLDVDSELIIYPGASHGLKKYSQRQAKLSWDLSWLFKYVLKDTTSVEKPPVF